jgi:hypothetical protein
MEEARLEGACAPDSRNIVANERLAAVILLPAFLRW